MNEIGIRKESFGVTADATAVDRYTLTNVQGATARLMTYGATLTELRVPDRQGRFDDVVLGFDCLADYESPRNPYCGATVGRVAFRIPEGKFVLDGREHRLSLNIPPHHLHGGPKGLGRVVWQAEPAGPLAVKSTITSPDGDQGYPGTLRANVVYRLTEQNALQIDYEATADRPTPVNFTHHSYFNLAGAAAGGVLDHVLWLAASRYTPLDERKFPSGEIAAVDGTPLDFRRPTPLGARMTPGNAVAEGYDASYLVDRPDGDVSLMRVAVLEEPRTGRTMEVYSTQPGLVLYTANAFDGTLVGKGGAVYRKHAGVCLETAHPPNAPNCPKFPSVTLRPGETYRHTCVYRFR